METLNKTKHYSKWKLVKSLNDLQWLSLATLFDEAYPLTLQDKVSLINNVFDLPSVYQIK